MTIASYKTTVLAIDVTVTKYVNTLLLTKQRAFQFKSVHVEQVVKRLKKTGS